MDPPVTPEILLGYSEAERQKSKLFVCYYHSEFEDLIKEYSPALEESKEKAKKLVEASKQVKKEEQK